MLCFCVLYIGLIFTNKDTSTIEGGPAGIALFFVLGYIIGPVTALDQVFQQPALFVDQLNHTMKFLLGSLAKAHLVDYTPPPGYDEFVAIPFPANVYTGYKYFFVDYGWIGVIVAVLLIGFFHTLLYRKARTGTSGLGLFCFAMSMFPWSCLSSTTSIVRPALTSPSSALAVSTLPCDPQALCPAPRGSRRSGCCRPSLLEARGATPCSRLECGRHSLVDEDIARDAKRQQHDTPTPWSLRLLSISAPGSDCQFPTAE
jgi:hypothetical protein